MPIPPATLLRDPRHRVTLVHPAKGGGAGEKLKSHRDALHAELKVSLASQERHVCVDLKVWTIVPPCEPLFCTHVQATANGLSDADDDRGSIQPREIELIPEHETIFVLV